MTTEADPRVYFAAERTLLAWLRTAIAVIGLGFLIARFGVFLVMLRGQTEQTHQATASVIGTVFVFLGATMILGATWQHFQFSRTLSPQDRPQHYSMTFSLTVSALAASAAIILSAYLAMTTRPLLLSKPILDSAPPAAEVQDLSMFDDRGNRNR